MAKVKEVKIDGETLQIFDSAIYILESSAGCILQLDIVVTEVTVRKYAKEENLIVEIELEDGRIFNTIMHQQSIKGGLPQLNLFCDLYEKEEYPEILVVNENDSDFPKVGEGVTLKEIRTVEMPDEKITLKLKLPIDQAEWLGKQGRNLNRILTEAIYDYWEKRKIE